MSAFTEITRHVISNDGTRIGYRQIGSGEGLIICHGSGRISQNYRKLVLQLADTFTVYIPDRRGRGLSGPEGADYDIRIAAEDLIAVIRETGASLVFGHSAGGLVALETMLANPARRLAVYEPPISVNHSLPSSWLTDFEKALQENRVKKAMAISLKGLQVQKEISKMPSWLLMVLIHLLSLAESRREKGTRMLDLLHTLPADMRMAVSLDSQFSRYSQVNIPVLLMAGSQSPSYFHRGLKALETIMPQSEMKIFQGFDHYSPEEKVQEISGALKNFFNSGS